MQHPNDSPPNGKPPSDGITSQVLDSIRDENDPLTRQLDEVAEYARQAFSRALLQQIDAAECHARAQARVEALEADRRLLTTRCGELVHEITQLIYLHTTGDQLCSAADPGEVLEAMRDVVVNLIGGAEVAIWSVDEEASQLSLLESRGIDRASWLQVPLFGGLIGLVALTGERFVAGLEPGPMIDDLGWQLAPGEEKLTACIPLEVGDRVVAVIGLFSLLPQKDAFATFDLELFDMLASRGAEALLRSGGCDAVGWEFPS